MLAFDPRDVIPTRWSLRPEDTLALVFWTKDPSNLIEDRARLAPYNVKIHVTLTGWGEVEKGAPDLDRGTYLLQRTIETFGAANVRWRFSPVPILGRDEVLYRFERIAKAVGPMGIRHAVVAFLQQNDLMPETRTWSERINLLVLLANVAAAHGVSVGLCNEDNLLSRWGEYGGREGLSGMPKNLGAIVCAPPEDSAREGTCDGCGCAIMVDPFTINESCTFGCTYCYAADRAVSARKHNSTRTLPVVR